MTKRAGDVNMDTKEADGMITAVTNGKVATRTDADADDIPNF